MLSWTLSNLDSLLNGSQTIISLEPDTPTASQDAAKMIQQISGGTYVPASNPTMDTTLPNNAPVNPTNLKQWIVDAGKWANPISDFILGQFAGQQGTMGINGNLPSSTTASAASSSSVGFTIPTVNNSIWFTWLMYIFLLFIILISLYTLTAPDGTTETIIETAGKLATG